MKNLEEPKNAAISIIKRRGKSAKSDGAKNSDYSTEPEHRHGKLRWKSSAGDLTEKSDDKKKKKRKRKRDWINPLSHFATPIHDHEEVESTRIRKRSFPNRNESSSQIENPEIQLPLPKNGKRVIDTIIDKDVDSAYKSAFDNETFFEIVTAQTYGSISNYSVSKWSNSSRQMHYQFPKTIAYTKHNMVVDQIQTLVWSKAGLGYVIESIVRTKGVLYSDYFFLEIHTRLEKVAENQTKLLVLADIVWEKPCLIQSRIETETMSGTKKYYEVFEKELCSEVQKTDQKSLEVQKESIEPQTSIANKNQLTTEETLPMKRHNLFWAFILITFTLFMLTFAMFQLLDSLLLLSNRIENLEQRLLEQHQTSCKNLKLS